MQLQHHTVFKQHGLFAGWPSNHGAWQWGNEFLVGFMTGPYTGVMRGHKIGRPYTKMLARSFDGGENWSIETPNVDFEASVVERDPPRFDLGGATIIRCCGVYDTGGEKCFSEGGFYLSHDRGWTWDGPFRFKGIEKLFQEKFECTARTDVVDNIVMVTNRVAHSFGTDRAFATVWNGERFELRGIICNDFARAACPSTVMVDGRLVTALRRANTQGYWIEAFASEDDGVEWRPLAVVCRMKSSNGNPPALIETNGVLVCAWGDRDAHAIKVSLSNDRGESWSEPVIVRAGGKSDIGYPQLFRRKDGNVVCVYYWAEPGEHQHIEATRLTLF